MSGGNSTESESEAYASLSNISAAQPQKEREIDEVMDFLKFSVKPSASFGGTILFRFKDKDDPEPKTTYAVEVSDMRKVTTRKNVNAREERPTCEVTLSMDDFLWIYSGKASSTDLAKLFYAGRVVISGYAFRTVSRFAQSFDFSSEKWLNFYAKREMEQTMNGSSRSFSAENSPTDPVSLSKDHWYFYTTNLLHISKLRRLLWETSLVSLFGKKIVLESISRSSTPKIICDRCNVILSAIGISNLMWTTYKHPTSSLIQSDQLYYKHDLRADLEKFLNPCTKQSSKVTNSILMNKSEQTAEIVFDFLSEEFVDAVKLSAKERQQRRHRRRVDFGDAGMAQLDKLVKVIGKGGHSNLKRDNCSKYVPAPEVLLHGFRVNVAVIMDALKEKAFGRKALHKIPAPEMAWLMRNRRSGSMVISDCSNSRGDLKNEANLALPASTLPSFPQSIIVEVNRAKIARNRKRFALPRQRIKAKIATFSRELVSQRNPVTSHLDEHLVFSDYL
ncbi:hypothetical protein CCR75_002054 [Bremia lactucae]|uniref:Uncharacterized protein n=1 Tax=Bremia lactucae TaxID=4779 RepID=A0A976FFB3_BRELC|nr:hypothetical protein CCR75_002054 [Bremia lactucae]